MEELSLLEKFGVLFDNIFQHPLFIVILLVPAIIFLLQKKHGKKAFVFVYLLVIVFVLYIGGEVIFELFDNLMNGLFMTLYFPNFITLFVVVVLCSIIALFSFFSKKMFKVNKIINITGFAVVQMLFVLVLTVIRSNDIDIYADNALYSNSDVLTLMQLLIGTFALQVIAIAIINGINKVTDILDKRSTPLAEDISEEINNLEKTKKNNLRLIKNIEIDNTKVGYINVADKANTSKPKLKPFKFDVDKLEAITLNVPIVSEFSDKPEITESVTSKDDSLVITPEVKPSFKNKFNTAFKNVKDNIEKQSKNKSKNKKVLLPEERSKPVITSKPDLFKPMVNGVSLEDNLIKKEIQTISGKSLKSAKKFINDVKPEAIRPDLFKPEDSPIKVISEVSHPKLVKPSKAFNEPVCLVDNLKILDIQSTLDTVIKYKLMKGVKLKTIENNDDLAVDNLQIPDFDLMMRVLRKGKLYKK